MSDIAISVDNVSKSYWVGHRFARANGHSTLRDVLTREARNFSRKALDFTAGRQIVQGDEIEQFWALRDVSFEVKRGEVIGIIGRNGAGKSTLLKILSRITEPDCGRVTLRGRVASLLEVGTGFHPELTGRENIFLNGAILGMTRAEIKAKFDEIVAFAEVEKFLDTPVKRYSSGMYLRLAFAVAAYLRPHILLIDEILAVGDVAFQEKCLGKMSEVASKGRTVVFISHNMAAIRTLCSHCGILQDGRLEFFGVTGEAVDLYLKRNTSSRSSLRAEFSRPAGKSPWVRSAELNGHCEASEQIMLGDELTIKVGFESDAPIRNPRLGYVVSTLDDTPLISANNRYQTPETLPKGTFRGTITCALGAVPLMPGRYNISFWLGDHAMDTHVIHNALSFEVVAFDIWGTAKIPDSRASLLWWPTTFTIESD
jgi:lipopolysaccharide transport system ATP-binding protein